MLGLFLLDVLGDLRSYAVILFFAQCFRDGFLPIKINYDDQNVEVWKRNVQCHELTFFACNA